MLASNLHPNIFFIWIDSIKTRQQLDAGVGVCWTAHRQQHTDSSPSKDKTNFHRTVPSSAFSRCLWGIHIQRLLVGWKHLAAVRTGQQQRQFSSRTDGEAQTVRQLFIQHLKPPRASTATDLWHSPADVCFKIIYFSSLISLYIKIVTISLMASRRRPCGLQRPVVL